MSHNVVFGGLARAACTTVACCFTICTTAAEPAATPVPAGRATGADPARINPMTGRTEAVEALRMRLARLQLQGRIETELTAIARARQERGRLAGPDDDDASLFTAPAAAPAAPRPRATLSVAQPGPAAPVAAGPAFRPAFAAGPGSPAVRRSAAIAPDGTAPSTGTAGRVVADGAPSAGSIADVGAAALPDAAGVRGAGASEAADGSPGPASPAARLIGVIADGQPRSDGTAPVLALMDVGGRVVAVPPGTRLGATTVGRVTRDGALVDGRWQPLAVAPGRVALPARLDEGTRAPLAAGALAALPPAYPR